MLVTLKQPQQRSFRLYEKWNEMNAIESKISTYIERGQNRELAEVLQNNPSVWNELGSWFIVAVLAHNFEAISILYRFYPDVNFRNSDGESAFSYACVEDQFEIAKLLHCLGASINAPDLQGATPLDWAVCHASPEFRTWLKSIGGRRNFNDPEWPYKSH